MMTGIEMLREWANELRDVARAHHDGEIDYVPIDVEACQRKNAARLDAIADQIEREAERTCRMTKKGPEFILEGWWQCGECGIVYPPCNEEIARWALQYCPRCGARVVME